MSDLKMTTVVKKNELEFIHESGKDYFKKRIFISDDGLLLKTESNFQESEFVKFNECEVKILKEFLK